MVGHVWVVASLAAILEEGGMHIGLSEGGTIMAGIAGGSGLCFEEFLKWAVVRIMAVVATTVSHRFVNGNLVLGHGHGAMAWKTEVRRILAQEKAADHAVRQMAGLAILFFQWRVDVALEIFFRHLWMAVDTTAPNRFLR